MAKSKHTEFKTAAVIMFVFMAFFVLLDSKYKKREKQQEIQRQEQRGKDFANYIIKDTQQWVAENQDTSKIKHAAQEYNKNPTEYDKKMSGLIADSTKYADAIFRDAGVINNLDVLQRKSVSFEEAMEYVDSQKAEYMVVQEKTIIHMEYDAYGEPIPWTEHIPNGDTIMEYNRSPARIIKINKGYLRNISLELAIRRLGKSY